MFEKLFGSALLEVRVPDTSLEYPPATSADEWLARLKADPTERKQAFFDEQLHSFLTIRIEHPSADAADPDHPPAELQAFLAHIQISLEATYISSIVPETYSSPLLATPPRSVSLAKLAPRPNSHHPSIFPPHTPNPTPSTADNDRRYVQAEGTLLLASIWGQDTAEDSREAFTLLWSEAEKVWVAVYRLVVTVAFLRLDMNDPLLCLTVSATLRERSVAPTQSKNPLVSFFASKGGLQPLSAPSSPTSPDGKDENVRETTLDGLEEVNLLEGLRAGPTFSGSTPTSISLPSTRLGPISRKQLFSLPPATAQAPAAVATSPTTARSHPTLRKSFRKTLATVSGFRVRMRTVFVPYVLLPEAYGGSSANESEDERERREAGDEERTVILCVEIENSGDSGPGVGFVVEDVDVAISGEGAKASLIGWDDILSKLDAVATAYPLFIGSMEQYNLLYAVSFLRSPADLSSPSFATEGGYTPGTQLSELQRAVTINIHGRPFTISPTNDDSAITKVYPTHTFSSRWNCILDLSTQPQQPPSADPSGFPIPSVLPEPASPFPAMSPRASALMSPPAISRQSPSPGVTPLTATAGKRHTLPGSPLTSSLSKRPSTPSNFRAATSKLNPNRNEQSIPGPFTASPGKLTYIPPSIAAAVQTPRTPTTYAPPPPPPLSIMPYGDNSGSYDQAPPATPAYPAYPQGPALPPTPMSQSPLEAQQAGYIGPSVEIRRERGAVGGGLGTPQTPGPLVMGGFGGQQDLMQHTHIGEGVKNIIVSVGLLPVHPGQTKTAGLGPGKIFPLDCFALDIFVFNQSAWTRRFEVSYPERRQWRRHGGDLGGRRAYGLLSLDNRVRIGPLRPSTCQSVRMEFMAVAPGVHSIDTLMLTDVESGFSMNLRSVMDIVVHERNESQ